MKGRSLIGRSVLIASVALVALTILFLTLLKSDFSLGGLWNAAAHNQRSIDLVPFNGFVNPSIWYGPFTNTLGNLLLFLPVGILVVLLTRSFGPATGPRPSRRRLLLRAGLIGLACSFGIEVAQFVFARGYSDIDDLILNTAGAVVGAWLAVRLNADGHRYALRLIWAGCSIILVLMFAGAVSA